MLEPNSCVFSRASLAENTHVLGRDWKRTQLAGQVCSHLLGPWQTVWAFQNCTEESIHITDTHLPQAALLFQLSESHQLLCQGAGTVNCQLWVSFQRFGGLNTVLCSYQRSYCWSAWPEKIWEKATILQAEKHLQLELKLVVLMKKDMMEVNTGCKILFLRIPWFLFQKAIVYWFWIKSESIFFYCVAKKHKALLVPVLKLWLPSSNENRHTPQWLVLNAKQKVVEDLPAVWPYLFSRTIVSILL